MYGAQSAYWAFRGLYALASVSNHAINEDSTFLPEVQEIWRTLECGFIDEHPFMEKMLVDLHESRPESAMDFAQRYSVGIAYQAIAMANLERNKLMTKITSRSDTA